MSTQTKLELRSLAHHLKPVVMIGDKGLTEAVKKEIESALLVHELIKIRVNAQDKEQRRLMIDDMCQTHHAELVQLIGHVVTLYRKKPEEKRKKVLKKELGKRTKSKIRKN